MHMHSNDSCSAGNLLDCCLFFTANSLARVITRLGEEEFQRVGVTPSAAFLLLQVIEQPGILQKDLADKLHLAQSTVSRLVDSMVKSGLVSKAGQGRNTFISPTPAGRELQPRILQAWEALRQRYSAALGEAEGEQLTALTREACRKLESD